MTAATTSSGTSSHRRDRGSLSIMLVVFVTVTLGGGALVVDGGRAMAARRHAANTAEAAARRAVAEQSLTRGFDPDMARSVALDHAVRSGVDAGDVLVTIRTGPTGEAEVVVTITERRRAVFLALGGADEFSVRASGAATVVYAT